MQERLIKTLMGTFIAGTWTGKDTSGIVPLGDNVVVKPDKVADKVGSIIITEQQKERQQFAAESGILVGLGPDAYLWSSDRQRKFEGVRPQPGQHVVMKRYSGISTFGLDGEIYWVMSDSCIGAVYADQPQESPAE